MSSARTWSTMLGMVAAMMVMVMGMVDRDLWAPAAIRKGKVWEKVMGKNGGKGRGKGGHPPPTPTPKVPKEKKPKTPNQLARAVSCFNLK